MLHGLEVAKEKEAKMFGDKKITLSWRTEEVVMVCVRKEMAEEGNGERAS